MCYFCTITVARLVCCHTQNKALQSKRESLISWLGIFIRCGESTVLIHDANCTAEADSPPFEMQVSQRILFVSYRLSTMLSVVSHDTFPWPAVSTYKSQQCCQNSRTVSAESICKMSSWAIASSGASQHPVILRCLWPLSATQKLFYSCLKDISDHSSVNQL